MWRMCRNNSLSSCFLSVFMREISKEQRIQRIAARIKELRIKAGYTSYEKFAFEARIDHKS